MANDLDVLDAAFAPGDGTMRGDAAGLLVGHDAISAFRGVRGGVPPRVIERIEYRALGPDAALLVSVSRFAGGGTGLQTQVWERIDGRWLITAAHVTPRAQALDRSVWRTVGDPLWQGAWEGPLAGLTVAVKDLFAIKGYRIGAGNPAFLDEARAETTTAAAVTDLLRGGASLRGIARTDEFAYSIAGDNVHYGTPPNGALPGALPGRILERSGIRRRHRPGRDRPRDRHRRVGAGARVVPGAVGAAHDARPRAAAGPAAPRAVLRHDRLAHPRRRDAAAGRGLVPQLRRVGVDRERVRRVGRRPAVALRGARRGARRGRTRRRARRSTRLLARLAASTDAAPVEIASIGDLDDYFVPFRTVQGAEAWRNNGEWVQRAPGRARPRRRRAVPRSPPRSTAEDEASARRALEPLAERVHALVADAVLLMPTVPGPAPMRTAVGERVERRARRDAADDDPGRDRRPAVALGAAAHRALAARPRAGRACASPRARGTDIALVRLARRLADGDVTACLAPSARLPPSARPSARSRRAVDEKSCTRRRPTPQETS